MEVLTVDDVPVLSEVLERMSGPESKCALLDLERTLERVRDHHYEREQCHEREEDRYYVDNYLKPCLILFDG